MKRYWLLTLALPAAAAACGGGDNTNAVTPAPDRVMGIELRCDKWMADGSRREYWGDVCIASGYEAVAEIPDSSVVYRDPPSGGSTLYVYNRRKVLTIRGAAYSYTVAVSLTTQVAVGDEWPPK